MEQAISRRRLLQAGVLAGAAMAVPVAVRGFGTGSYRPMPYAFTHGRDVLLRLTSGERFTIEVLVGGALVERHDDVTEASVTELESAYFRAERIAAPTPAAA